MTAKFITENSEYTDFGEFDKQINNCLDLIIFHPIYNKPRGSCATRVMVILIDDVEDVGDSVYNIGFDCGEFELL